jgi:hypothetical protein
MKLMTVPLQALPLKTIVMPTMSNPTRIRTTLSTPVPASARMPSTTAATPAIAWIQPNPRPFGLPGLHFQA